MKIVNGVALSFLILLASVERVNSKVTMNTATTIGVTVGAVAGLIAITILGKAIWKQIVESQKNEYFEKLVAEGKNADQIFSDLNNARTSGTLSDIPEFKALSSSQLSSLSSTINREAQSLKNQPINTAEQRLNQLSNAKTIDEFDSMLDNFAPPAPPAPPTVSKYQTTSQGDGNEIDFGGIEPQLVLGRGTTVAAKNQAAVKRAQQAQDELSSQMNTRRVDIINRTKGKNNIEKSAYADKYLQLEDRINNLRNSGLRTDDYSTITKNMNSISNQLETLKNIDPKLVNKLKVELDLLKPKVDALQSLENSIAKTNAIAESNPAQAAKELKSLRASFDNPYFESLKNNKSLLNKINNIEEKISPRQTKTVQSTSKDEDLYSDFIPVGHDAQMAYAKAASDFNEALSEGMGINKFVEDYENLHSAEQNALIEAGQKPQSINEDYVDTGYEFLLSDYVRNPQLYSKYNGDVVSIINSYRNKLGFAEKTPSQISDSLEKLTPAQQKRIGGEYGKAKFDEIITSIKNKATITPTNVSESDASVTAIELAARANAQQQTQQESLTNETSQSAATTSPDANAAAEAAAKAKIAQLDDERATAVDATAKAQEGESGVSIGEGPETEGF